MPNVALALKQEITRLSRKEVRGQTHSLRQATRHGLRNIAALKRQIAHIAQVQNHLNQLIRGQETNGHAVEADEGKALRFRRQGFITQRRKLGLSAEQLGKLIGVTSHTVYMWEHGRSRPRKSKLSALAAIRGMGKKEARERLAQMGRKSGTKRRRRAGGRLSLSRHKR